MLNIGPINYNNSNYRVVRTNKKVTPVSGTNSDRSNSDSNSSEFERILQEEIQKQIKKGKKN